VDSSDSVQRQEDNFRVFLIIPMKTPMPLYEKEIVIFFFKPIFFDIEESVTDQIDHL